MKPLFDNQSPIYIQIMNVIQLRIISGEMKAGEKIDSVRDMASGFGVNPNTMQRALSELEREKLVYTERTTGRFVTTDKTLIHGLQDKLIEGELKGFLQKMKEMGYTKEMIIQKITEQREEEA